MERELWWQLYRRLLSLATPKPKRNIFSDVIIVAVYLWAVLHDRPVCWAVSDRSWGDIDRPFELPSQSTLSRRLRQESVRLLLNQVERTMAGNEQQQTLVKIVDSKPLPVGAYSRVKDARWGQGIKGLLKGYKLHAIYGAGSLPIAWEVVPMNASEQRVAKRLFTKLSGGGYVLADSVYDINKLYDLAAQFNHQLLAKRKRPEAGLGERRHSVHRLRAVEMLEWETTGFGYELYKMRTRIERKFSLLTSFGGGLSPLPNWVRGLRRVRLWVQSKILIAALRAPARKGLAA